MTNRISAKANFFAWTWYPPWYKRNLIRYANVSNQVLQADENIVVIAGRAAVMEDFIGNKLIRINEVLKRYIL
ncbi:DUF5694 domain-containing protein [Pedobacter suwonensis]|uniref:DUF5694 domain-containing protein n=1 Tax=Pedobacter suwonensis TaxID=332999 RepID=UPI00345BB860